MRSLLVSIKPKWVAKILNGEKTLEIRKTAPKDLPCEVYIYCTKDKNELRLFDKEICEQFKIKCARVYSPLEQKYYTVLIGKKSVPCNGKVIAKFTLNKVSKIVSMLYGADEDECAREHCYETRELDSDELLKRSCLTYEQMHSYLGCLDDEVGYAWHIDKLVIFDKPKELKEFGVKRSPQSYMYVEVDE